MSSLTASERDRITDALDECTYQENDVIFRKGDESSELYIVEEGCAAAMLDGQVVKTYNVGEFFGERAFLHTQSDVSGTAPRAADMVAMSSPTKVLVLDPEAFRRLNG